MNKLERLMIDVPVYTTENQEKSYINSSKEYFIVTPTEFCIYAKANKCWYCLRTKLVVPGNISDIIDKNGNMFLYVKGKPVTSGKWGTADSIDTILDFYNSGDYLTWLAAQM